MTIINKRKPNVNYRNVTTPSAPISVDVSTESILVLPQNNDRVGVIVVNLSSDTNVYLAFGYPAILNGGLTLLPYIGWKMDEFTFCVEGIYAISDSSVTLSIQEFVL